MCIRDRPEPLQRNRSPESPGFRMVFSEDPLGGGPDAASSCEDANKHSSCRPTLRRDLPARRFAGFARSTSRHPQSPNKRASRPAQKRSECSALRRRHESRGPGTTTSPSAPAEPFPPTHLERGVPAGGVQLGEALLEARQLG
eukprot:6815635-Pyramimonas_sp.AAC.2